MFIGRDRQLMCLEKMYNSKALKCPTYMAEGVYLINYILYIEGFIISPNKIIVNYSKMSVTATDTFFIFQR